MVRSVSTATSAGPGEVAALLLRDWELGRVALSCHVAMDLLCQEVRDACWGSSRIAGLTSFTVITVPEQLSCGFVTAAKPFSHRGRAATKKERDVVRENEGRRNVGGEPFFESGWLVSFL